MFGDGVDFLARGSALWSHFIFFFLYVMEP
jgi:hypothetical protein